LASRRGINAAILAQIIPQYKVVKGVGVSVSRMDKRHNFWNSMCIVPILKQLPQYEEMKGGDFWHDDIDQIYNWRLAEGQE